MMTSYCLSSPSLTHVTLCRSDHEKSALSFITNTFSLSFFLPHAHIHTHFSFVDVGWVFTTHYIAHVCVCECVWGCMCSWVRVKLVHWLSKMRGNSWTENGCEQKQTEYHNVWSEYKVHSCQQLIPDSRTVETDARSIK